MKTPQKNIDVGLLVASTVGIYERSSKWSKVQAQHLLKQPYCIACGKNVKYTNGLQVHHIIPYHICIELGRADLELDERNLISLCQTQENITTPNHHLIIGHLNDWESFNKTVKTNASKTFYAQSSAQIKLNLTWLKMCLKKPKRITDMSSLEKQQLTQYINKKFPLTK